MLKKVALLFIAIGCLLSASAQTIQSPAEFLGYKLGEQFTPHYRIAQYFEYIAKASKNVKLVQYGTTNEGRPLMAMFIASPENIVRLEAIRINNLRLAGIEESTTTTLVTTTTPAIVWLSYNVHGNEPSSSEAAMATLFDIIDPANQKTKGWLKNTVVVIDPCLNPDGRDRYVSFYNSVKGAEPDADPASREHQEPWPSGRTNHYYFDLNRDWVWQSQKETQARLALYGQWLPQVHVDFHEQNYNSPYYFAPAAEPLHKDITTWQREFQTIIGKNNAKYFDQNGWLYFTRQEFDLLYPSYGDTYPIYNGSIGMTYEQGGIGAGLAIVTNLGDTLTLADRIAHHHSNGLSTVETTSAYAQKAVTEFKKYFDDSRANPPGDYKTYVIKNDNADKIEALAKLLDRNGIQYGFGLKENWVTGYNYFSGKSESSTVLNTDMVINAYQPKSVLLNVLFEPKTFIADSATYDITAWSLPYAYGLKTYGVKESYKPLTNTLATVKKVIPAGNAYAYVCAWQSVEDAQFLAALLKEKIRVRYTETPFEVNGKKFAAGSLIITKAGNNRSDFNTIITRAATDFNRELTQLSSGFVDKGADFGSSNIKYISPPKVIIIAGDGVSSGAMGEVWQFFEQQVKYPATIVKYSDLGQAKLSDFDVIIFPNGKYEDFPSDKLQGWVRDGGKLIALESVVEQLADKKVFELKSKEDKKEDKPAKPGAQTDRIYENRDREAIRSNVAGAIYNLNIDNTHPLGFGLPKYYYSLKQGSDIYELLSNDAGWNVGTVKRDNYVAGFVGQKSKDKIKDGLLLGVEKVGKGSVIYMVDDPLFRNFWEGGKLLFSNAVFMTQ